MAEPVVEIPREAWQTIEATEQARVLDFPIGDHASMSRVELQPFTETPWMHAPYAEIVCCYGGWGTLISGEPDQPKTFRLNPGDIVAVEPGEWWRLDTAVAGLRLLTFWDGRRSEKRYAAER